MLKQMVDALFENTGETIKDNAKKTMMGTIILLLIVAIVAVLGGVIMCCTGEVVGIYVGVGVPVAALIVGYGIWRFLLLVYGYGEMVECANLWRAINAKQIPTEEATVKPSKNITASTKTFQKPEGQKPEVNPVKPAPAKPKAPQMDMTPYIGKKFCRSCGEVLDASKTMCACGGKYLVELKEDNAYALLKDKIARKMGMCPDCGGKLNKSTFDNSLICSECGHLFG